MLSISHPARDPSPKSFDANVQYIWKQKSLGHEKVPIPGSLKGVNTSKTVCFPSETD